MSASQFPASSLNSKLLVGKSNTVAEASIGSVAVTGVGSSASAWGQVSASLGSDTLLTQVAIKLGSGSLSAAGVTTVDLAVGGGGSETAIATIIVVPNIASSTLAFGSARIPARAGSGQRLAARINLPDSSGNASSVTISVYGATYSNTEGN